MSPIARPCCTRKPMGSVVCCSKRGRWRLSNASDTSQGSTSARIGLLQVGPSEGSALQAYLAQVGFLQVRFTQVSFLQVRPGEECSLQVRPDEECSLQVRFVQRHFFQVYPDERSLLQVRFAQIGSREQNCC